MFILQVKGIKSPPGIIPLQAVDNDAVRKQTIIPIQEMNKQHMETWKKNRQDWQSMKKTTIATRKSSDSRSGIEFNDEN